MPESGARHPKGTGLGSYHACSGACTCYVKKNANVALIRTPVYSKRLSHRSRIQKLLRNKFACWHAVGSFAHMSPSSHETEIKKNTFGRRCSKPLRVFVQHVTVGLLRRNGTLMVVCELAHRKSGPRKFRRCARSDKHDDIQALNVRMKRESNHTLA